MGTPPVQQWRPASATDLQGLLQGFDRWVLCGGTSIDWLLGKATRDHGDTDVGVFRSDLADCLKSMPASRVFLCDPPGKLRAWDSGPVPPHVHGLWILDAEEKHWAFQILIYDDDGENVYYRRDPRVSWAKSDHAVEVRGLRVLNPVVTLLFKLHRQNLRDQDCADVSVLIAALAKRAVQKK